MLQPHSPFIDREVARATLLEAVDGIAAILSDDAARADDARHLQPSTVDALRRSGLLALKLPRSLGGFEADNALQFEVIERVAYHSTAAAWCLFIYTDIVAKVAAFLPDAALSRFLGDGDLPVVCGGGGLIPGTLVPVEGGYRLSGDWIYGSGNTGADWFMVLGLDATGDNAPRMLFCVVPANAMVVADSWHVVGMRGTGSSDYSTRDTFVPSDMTFPLEAAPLRGGGIFLLGLMGYAAHTIAATAMGGTARALDDIARMAEAKARGYGKKTPLARRGVFQAFLGRSHLTLSAMRAMMLDVGQRIVAEADAGGTNPLSTEIESRAAASLATQATVGIMSDILRYAGGEGARAGHRIERTARDVMMAQTHFYVSDSAIELHGRSLLGERDLDAAS